jgi:hypothetical protein
MASINICKGRFFVKFHVLDLCENCRHIQNVVKIETLKHLMYCTPYINCNILPLSVFVPETGFSPCQVRAKAEKNFGDRNITDFYDGL